MTRSRSRPKRWAAAAEAAQAALQDLVDLQAEYQEWRDNLPENLEAGTLAEKLEAVVDLDLGGALETAEEAVEADLPLGFGRD